MKDKNSYLLLHIVAAALIVIIGILCMWLGTPLGGNIGSVLLISGIYTIFDNMLLKKSLVDLVIQKVQLDQEIDNSGLIKLDSTLTNINYKELLENAKSNIDIVHNYARTWTTNNYDFIKETVMNSNCHLRVVLLNSKSPFVPALEKHYGYGDGQLNNLIKEVSDKWISLYREAEEKRKKCRNKRNNISLYKNKKCGTVELYYFNGQPTNSIYRIDDKIIVVSCKNSKEKSIHLPYMVFQENGKIGMYNTYLDEIENVIQEATKLDLEGNNVTHS